VIGHGQLPEAELERVMLAFMNHEYDVLVATSIIENGLDIPLANTIIVNRADRHGLSELYQLRGRVGRSNRRAYAYLLIPPETELTEVARRRLAALKEFSDLGAGFKIAALDLELRGAGNMLGGEQSGHIEAVGFEMYTTMLEEAVRKMKGEEEKPAHAGTAINLGISVRIDSSYIPEENQRLRMYKRIAGAEDAAALEDVRAELQDRYGEPPESVLNLLAAGELRLLCERLGIAQLDRKRTQVDWVAAAPAAPSQPGRRAQPVKETKTFAEMLHIRFGAAVADSSQNDSVADSNFDPGTMMKLVARNAKRGAQFTPQGVLRWPLSSAKAQDVIRETRELLEGLTATAAA
jgi:transcription-repair coupling factor (superfamily II helicase)